MALNHTLTLGIECKAIPPTRTRNESDFGALGTCYENRTRSGLLVKSKINAIWYLGLSLCHCSSLPRGRDSIHQ